jgi:hypothetical protein
MVPFASKNTKLDGGHAQKKELILINQLPIKSIE